MEKVHFRVRSSRLALTCANAVLFRSRPRVRRGQPTRLEAPYAIARTFPRKRGVHLPWPQPAAAARRGQAQT
jgi:hypothetical protein